MTTRRTFIKGGFAVATASVIPGQDPFEFNERNFEEILGEEFGPGMPTLSFVTDNDTGMFRAGHDTLKLVVGGVEKLNET